MLSRPAAIALVFWCSTSLLPAQQTAPPVYYSVPPADAPELAHRGPFSVGVRTLPIVHQGQPDILRFDAATGKAPLADRSLTLEIWYPASLAPGQTEHTEYEMGMPGAPDRLPPGVPASFKILGKAARDATPVRGQTFPLVVVSHGYPGSRVFLSYLTENLASKGYVVAAIDHTDSVVGAVKPFPSTLLNRSADQLFTIEALTALAAQQAHFLHGLADVSRVAIVGYSMGGYGALTSAGAGLNPASPLNKMVPGDQLSAWTAGSAPYLSQRRDALKAVVAIAPWGAQPPYQSWSAEALAAIRLPLLFIAGDQDDISNYAQGIKPAFERAVHSDRCLLVYENANHNVGGNPAPAAALGGFTTREFFDEPVWRKDRIAAINQHFITAFLDLTLKGDQSRRTYLHPAVERSNDGVWPLERGQSAGGAYSPGGGQPGLTYWKGFQRRWALGLQMRCAAPSP